MSEMDVCSASVTFLQWDSSSQPIWIIEFRVEIEGTDYSAGTFEFDMNTVNADGNSQTIRKQESWRAIEQTTVDVSYEIYLSPGEEITGITVDSASVRCVPSQN